MAAAAVEASVTQCLAAAAAARIAVAVYLLQQLHIMEMVLLLFDIQVLFQLLLIR